MTLREFITFLGVTDLDAVLDFDDLGMNPIHPQDYCLKISSTPSGEVYWQFFRKGELIKPNLIEERFLKSFVRVANRKINHE